MGNGTLSHKGPVHARLWTHLVRLTPSQRGLKGIFLNRARCVQYPPENPDAKGIYVAASRALMQCVRGVVSSLFFPPCGKGGERSPPPLHTLWLFGP